MNFSFSIDDIPNYCENKETCLDNLTFLITVEGKKCSSYLKEQSYNDLFARSPYLLLL